MQPTNGAADPLRGLGNPKRAYVVPDVKLMYMSVAKNACTSLKWLVAELAGEDLQSFHREHSVRPDEQHIHNRDQFKRTPRLGQLPPKIRTQIHPDNGWFVFSVVRDPRVRLFSAWQSKFLFRNPGFQSYRDEPWYPRRPRSVANVIDDFGTFATMLEADPNHPLHQDTHFATQTKLLREDLVTYTRLYDISEMAQLVRDLSDHLRGIGRHDNLTLRRANETSLTANADAFQPGVREAIERLYASDFDAFGSHWSFDRIAQRPPWTDGDLTHIAQVVRMTERINDLGEEAAKRKRINASLRDRIKGLESALSQSQPRKPPGRLRRVKRALANRRWPFRWVNPSR